MCVCVCVCVCVQACPSCNGELPGGFPYLVLHIIVLCATLSLDEALSIAPTGTVQEGHANIEWTVSGKPNDWCSCVCVCVRACVHACVCVHVYVCVCSILR